MINRIMALLAFAGLAGFLGILVWKVPRPDLLAIVALTLALAGWDIVRGVGRRRR
jgi:hypothetical protein